jgi:outer membrane protein OmpA-like peptidoglycan-associated protein
MPFCADRHRAGPVAKLVVLALIAGLAACHPIDTWRSWTGADKNDPDPETTPNTKNLAAGEAQPYPNLASVPAPPIPTLTQAERDKLTESLIADRTNAKYSEQKLLPGIPAGAQAPPPPPPQPRVAGNAPMPAPGGAASPPGTAPPAPPPSPRKPGEPAEPGPSESNLQVPQMRETPQPQTPQPPPAPPQVSPAPPPASAPLNPASVAAANPQPAPPPPALPQPAPSPAPPPGRIEPRTAVATVATISFPAASTVLPAADHASVDKVAALYRQKPTAVRVVAYAPESGDGREQLANYRAALSRAQAVAQALADAGIPPAKIATEAAPSPSNGPSGRVDIQFVS